MFHPLSLFPSLLDFRLFAPLILRIAAGVFLFLVAYDSVKASKNSDSDTNVSPISTNTTISNRSLLKMTVGILLFIISLWMIIGLFTQGVAIGAIVLLALNTIFREKLLNTSNISGDAILLIIVICLSLLIFGAGMPAIDLPL